VVRDAFIARGHDAWSCDLLPTEADGPHLQDDALRMAHLFPWDLMIAHPPCTYLTLSGRRWWSGKEQQQRQAIEFVRALLDAPIPRIALENPRGILGVHVRQYDQTIQPWQFGHGEVKTTDLWLKNLPYLEPTHIVPGRMARVHRMSRSAHRSMERSRTLPGVAAAMAEQWG